MSEDKVRTKDLCWSVGTIYDPRELPGLSTASLGIGRCRYLETGVPLVTRWRRWANGEVSGCVENSSPPRHISRPGVATWPKEGTCSRYTHGVWTYYVEDTEPRTWRADLRDGSRTLPSGVRTNHRRVPGFWGREYPDPTLGGVRGWHVPRPSLVRTCPHNVPIPWQSGGLVQSSGLLCMT
jgi:hypothetical protein